MKNKPNTNNKIDPIDDETRDRQVYPLAGMNVVQCWCSTPQLPTFSYIPITLEMLAEIRSGKPYLTMRRFSCGHKVRVSFRDTGGN